MAINSNYTTESSYNIANTIDFAINRKLLDLNTILPCQIISINQDNTYNVQPLINSLDSNGKPITQNIIYDIPATVRRGGNAGIITEYQVNDTVLVGFCQRDLTTCKQNWQQSNPQSLRKFWLTDGIILDAVSNTLPTVYIKITSSGIEINANDQEINLQTTNNVNINADTVNVNSGSVNLGNGADLGVILENTELNIHLPGMSGGGNGYTSMGAVIKGGSNTVKGAM